ncbi:hypothetical protein VTL71DRAFT_6760 [Oculimacula yallundae]|uniref:C2H2-type domain-containing protein n=1 Tax=Oculimacula yallundae TaxID=86028 RepID=A0ABR4BZK1_9HELO
MADYFDPNRPRFSEGLDVELAPFLTEKWLFGNNSNPITGRKSEQRNIIHQEPVRAAGSLEVCQEANNFTSFGNAFQEPPPYILDSQGNPLYAFAYQNNSQFDCNPGQGSEHAFCSHVNQEVNMDSNRRNMVANNGNNEQSHAPAVMTHTNAYEDNARSAPSFSPNLAHFPPLNTSYADNTHGYPHAPLNRHVQPLLMELAILKPKLDYPASYSRSVPIVKDWHCRYCRRGFAERNKRNNHEERCRMKKNEKKDWSKDNMEDEEEQEGDKDVEGNENMEGGDEFGGDKWDDDPGDYQGGNGGGGFGSSGGQGVRDPVAVY